MVRRVLGVAAALLLAIIAGIVLTLSAEHHKAVTLPALTGPYSVGRASFDWVDQSRTEKLAPETRAKRELTVWIWYPASIEKTASALEYLPRPWRVALARRQGPLMANFMMHDTSLVQSRGFDNADVASAQRTYPVILMKPGIGALALYYTTLAEDLASDGYIVVASDSPYSTFLVAFHDGRVAYRRRAGNAGEAAPISEQNRAANRVISTWVADDRFVLDRLVQLNRSVSFGKFRGRLNLHAIGVMGHSFGGATAAEFCRQDSRCTAGIDIDGIPFGEVVQKGMDRPFMFLMSDHSKESGPEKQEATQRIQSLYKRLPQSRLLVTLRDSGHFSFSDLPLIYNHTLAQVSGAAGSLDATRGLAAAAACISTFFDIHLRGKSSSKLQELRTQYPELVFVDDSKPVGSQI